MNETEKLTTRLQQLREEEQKGLRLLADLQAQETDLRQKLLRISGAIQVLEELLQDQPPTPDVPARQA
jgi:uncharacterized protein (DUF3084 family)